MTEDGASILALFFGVLKCNKVFSCNRDLDEHVGIVLWFSLMLYMFKALGTICDEYFVPSLEVIVEKLQVTNDVAGATFMAAGSSAPELFTSLVATFLIVNAGGVGTIVGSAIFNILVMNGVTAFIACKDRELKIWWYPLARDTFFYSVAIIELVLVLWDEEVKWYEGFLMVFTYVLYCVYMKFNPKAIEFFNIANKAQEGAKHAVSPDSWWEPSAQGVCPEEPPKGVCPEEPSAQPVGKRNTPSVASTERKSWSYRESEQHQGSSAKRRSQAVCPAEEPDGSGTGGTGASPEHTFDSFPALSDDPSAPANGGGQARCSFCKDPLGLLWETTLPPPERTSGFALFSMSILWIGLCTYVMVDATNRIGIIVRIPSFVMGLVFLAAGTSIPDTLGSIAVAKQGEGDMAIANALGSNVFDILIGLGVPWTIRACFQRVEFKDQFRHLIGDIIILAVVLVLFVAALALNGWRLSRSIGNVLMFFYVAFVVYQVLAVFVFKWKEINDSE